MLLTIRRFVLSLVVSVACIVAVAGPASRALAGASGQAGETGGLRDYAERITTVGYGGRERPLMVGVAVNGGQFFPALENGDGSGYLALLAREFNIITAENAMKFRAVSTGPGEYDWSRADAMFDFAERHGMAVRYHAGIWHQAVPKWINKGREGEPEERTIGDDELRRIAYDHVRAIGERYGDRITYWDVVNEAVGEPQPEGHSLRPTMWSEVLGVDYVADLHRIAHEAAPKALLVYNDYKVVIGGPKADRVYDFVKGMVDDGVPLHAVGMQAHLNDGWWPDRETVVEQMRRFAALGLEVHITEFDHAIDMINGEPADELPRSHMFRRQARCYRDVLAAALEVPEFTVFQVWGVSDDRTWVGWLRDPRKPGVEVAPLMYDEHMRPKPAYDAVREVLRERAGR